MWEYNRDKDNERERSERDIALFLTSLIKATPEIGNKFSMQVVTHSHEPRAPSLSV